MKMKLCPGWQAGLGLAIFLAALGALPAQETGQQTNEVRQEERGKKRVFSFEGGNPLDFVVALDKHFRTRLVQVLTLPETLSRTKVPKLRVAAEDPREVLVLYNRLQSPTLGQWRFEPETSQKNNGTNMNVLMLVPDKSVAGKLERTVTKVKGFPLAGIPETKWEMVLRDIDEVRAHAEATERGTGDAIGGWLRIQRDSKVLIAAGSEAYLEMVESLVSAQRMNAEIEAKAGSGSKGTDPAPR